MTDQAFTQLWWAIFLLELPLVWLWHRWLENRTIERLMRRERSRLTSAPDQSTLTP